MTNSKSTDYDKEVMDFIDELGLLIKDTGLPKSVGRVLAWLLICEPQMQTAENIQDKLKLSSGSVSTATTMLQKISFVDRIKIPGDKRLYYQIDDNCWSKLIELRKRQFEVGREVSKKGKALSPGNKRIEGMFNVYDQLLDAIKDIKV